MRVGADDADAIVLFRPVAGSGCRAHAIAGEVRKLACDDRDSVPARDQILGKLEMSGAARFARRGEGLMDDEKVHWRKLNGLDKMHQACPVALSPTSDYTYPPWQSSLDPRLVSWI